MGASVTIITLLYTLSALVLALGFPHGIGSNPLLIGTPALLALVMLYLRQGHETGFIGDLQSLRLYAEHVAATYVRASRLISIAGAVLMALLLAWFLVSGLKLGSEWANHFFKGTALACLPACLPSTGLCIGCTAASVATSTRPGNWVCSPVWPISTIAEPVTGFPLIWLRVEKPLTPAPRIPRSPGRAPRSAARFLPGTRPGGRPNGTLYILEA